MTEHSEQAMREYVVFFNQSDSNATLSSLIILQSLLQFKRVRKDICEQRDLVLPTVCPSITIEGQEEKRKRKKKKDEPYDGSKPLLFFQGEQP
jgi:hypothetical protein